VKSLQALSLSLDNSGNSVHATEHTRSVITKNLKACLINWLIDTHHTRPHQLKAKAFLIDATQKLA
jgi:hypothetical protein